MKLMEHLCVDKILFYGNVCIIKYYFMELMCNKIHNNVPLNSFITNNIFHQLNVINQNIYMKKSKVYNNSMNHNVYLLLKDF